MEKRKDRKERGKWREERLVRGVDLLRHELWRAEHVGALAGKHVRPRGRVVVLCVLTVNAVRFCAVLCRLCGFVCLCVCADLCVCTRGPGEGGCLCVL